MAAKLNKGEMVVSGRANGLGELDPAGSYVRIIYTNDLASYGLTISEGAAAVLADELRGVINRPATSAA